MRKSTMLWLVLAAFCGVSLFHTSQKVHDNRLKLEELNQELGREEESIRVLQAEWSYLNQPLRLEKLAQEHFALAPLKGSQFVKANALPMRGAAVEAAPVVADIPEVKKPISAAAVKIRRAVRKEIIRERMDPVPNVPTAATVSNNRSFHDVMRSLGVNE